MNGLIGDGTEIRVIVYRMKSSWYQGLYETVFKILNKFECRTTFLRWVFLSKLEIILDELTKLRKAHVGVVACQ